MAITATDKPTQSVNTMELVRALMQISSATPATFIALTEVKMNKTNNPYFGRVQKKQKSNVFINFNYENAVNKALVKEGKEPDFKAKPRAWGNRIPNTPLVLHKNLYYLEARYLNNEPQVEYYVDGELTDKTVIQDYLPAEKVSETNSQNLDEQIIIRDFKLESIHEITVSGIRYVRNDIK